LPEESQVGRELNFRRLGWAAGAVCGLTVLSGVAALAGAVDGERDPVLLTLTIAIGVPCALLAYALVVFLITEVLRGVRAREAGIPCGLCQVGRAFPTGGSTNGYRCGHCRHRFDGPRHF
jgi:hypothetical protein